MQIEDLLVQKDLDVVLGDKLEKMSDANWTGLDRKVMSVICLSLTKNVAFNILKEKTTKEIMEVLSNMYEKPSVANKFFLIRELVNTRMKEDTSVTEHINKLNSILARLCQWALSSMIKFKLCYCYRLYLIVGLERLQRLLVQWDPSYPVQYRSPHIAPPPD
ncbi:unnamed protein product [Cuscuta campestris]|uniref:Reverse transcriptase Ty1/copia-type domain-containing protein n=1 Tax=Cuscuta campestris TaxID=132261 RepID=A0A484NCG9_9ASTE|nr:unnamed protein product [Cuscuta campestris]